MKVLHLNTFDIEGGAARAAWRLHQGLRELGTDSRMLVQTKTSGDETVDERDTELARWFGKFRPYMEIAPLLLYRHRPSTHWATEWTPTRIIQQIRVIKPDIIHLHWVCRGFLSISDIGNLPAPVVWTLHDSWAFTGGCHVPGSCTLYKKQCGMCPQLVSTEADDLSRWIWSQKAKHWAPANFTIVTPSQWLADCSRNSSLLHTHRTEVIPNGIDTALYHPVPKQEARAALSLPQDRKLVLISAMNATLDINKGFRHLEAALRQLAASGWKDKIELLVVGQAAPSTPVNAGVPVRFMGILKDDTAMSQAYSAADVTVLSSIQENLPNAIMESMACGTPVVAFNIGGIPQLIEHHVNGYLAAPFESADLASGIQMIISDDDARARFSAMARHKIVSTFDRRIIARQYQRLYEEVRGENSGSRIQNSPHPPIISIITVVRNGVTSIEACINSVAKYAGPDIEYIVIDGGSSDGTIDIIRKHEKAITIWDSEPDEGIYDAMNKGLKQARGQWVLFLGCDDELAISPSQLIPYLKSSQSIYYGNAYWRHLGRTHDGPFSAAKLARTNICQQAIFYPRSVFSKHPFNLRYRLQGDWELNMRCFTDPDYRFEYLPLTISVYNDATGASTLTRDLALETDYIALLWRHFPGLTAAWLSTLVIGGRLLRKIRFVGPPLVGAPKDNAKGRVKDGTPASGGPTKTGTPHDT